MKSRFLKLSRLALPAFLFVFLLCLPMSAPAEEETSILLTFTGDCTLGSQDYLWKDPSSFIQHIEKNGFSYPFENFRSFFEEDDLTVINLENVFYDINRNKADKNYTFRAPVEYAKILTEGSVELAFIANNHIMDYGKPGLLSTIQALEAQGVGWFGSNHEVVETFIFEKNGVKVGFIGSYQAYWYLDRERYGRHLQSLKDAGCQAIIGVIHDGTEYSPKRGRPQQLMANWMVRNGINLVVGHHPHVPQGVDRTEDATVLFSLGNFSFGGNKRLDINRRPGVRADKALVARVELRFGADKAYLGHQVNLIPVSPSGVTERNNYQPVFLTGEEALKTMELVQFDTGFPLAPYQEGIGALQPFVPAAPEAEETP